MTHSLALGAQLGGNLRKAPGHIYQHVLKGGGFRLFAAHTNLGAAFIAYGFLALVAEHGVAHEKSPYAPQGGGCAVIRLRGGLGGKNNGKQHLEALLCAHCMRLTSGHDDNLARLDRM